MECVIESPALASFARTSYISTPTCWRDLPPRQVATRIEHLLHAHYRIRAATLRTPEVDERMVPFAFDFEWTTRADIPATPGVRSDPWMFPYANRNPRLSEIASNELDARLQGARPGIESRCYRDAFEAFRVDEDDSWHIIDWRERASLFASRYEGKISHGL